MTDFGALLLTVLLMIGVRVPAAGGIAAVPVRIAATSLVVPVSVSIGSNGYLYVTEAGKKVMPHSGLRFPAGPLPPPATADCDSQEAIGRGFVAFSCESGGGATKYGHPQELLVVRTNGHFSSYPTNRHQDVLAVSATGEVVSAHNSSIVNVTALGITTIVSKEALDQLVVGKLLGDVLELAVQPDGEVLVALDYYAGVHRGCGDVLGEVTTGGKLRTLWRSGTGLVCR
jgi:hypothetical protein